MVAREQVDAFVRRIKGIEVFHSFEGPNPYWVEPFKCHHELFHKLFWFLDYQTSVGLKIQKQAWSENG